MSAPRLVRIAPDLHRVDATLTLPGGWAFPGRMTIWRDADGTLVLHAPLAIDDALAAELAELGEVGHLIAPDLQHHFFFEAAAARYPAARTYAVGGFAQKKPQMRYATTLGDDAPATLAGAVDSVHLHGAPAIGESVFFHRATRSLVCTDLVFRILEPPGTTSSVFLRLMGARGRFAQSRAWRLLTRDRRALAASLDRVLAWDFDRIVMAHGEVLETGGREQLREVTRWTRAT